VIGIENLKEGKDSVMEKKWKKVLTMISTFALTTSFLCYGTDANARNEITMLVCGDTKMESREAFNRLYHDLIGGHGLGLTKRGGCPRDPTIGVRGTVSMDDVSADLSANLNMYYVDDLKTIPELLIPSSLLVLIYAGKEAEGLGSLPVLQEKLKKRKHRIELPEMALLRLDEVLASSCDEDKRVRGCVLKLIKACGDMWPRCPIDEEESELNASGYSDTDD
jgi:hypothetical protein